MPILKFFPPYTSGGGRAWTPPKAAHSIAQVPHALPRDWYPRLSKELPRLYFLRQSKQRSVPTVNRYTNLVTYPIRVATTTSFVYVLATSSTRQLFGSVARCSTLGICNIGRLAFGISQVTTPNRLTRLVTRTCPAPMERINTWPRYPDKMLGP